MTLCTPIPHVQIRVWIINCSTHGLCMKNLDCIKNRKLHAQHTSSKSVFLSRSLKKKMKPFLNIGERCRGHYGTRGYLFFTIGSVTGRV